MRSNSPTLHRFNTQPPEGGWGAIDYFGIITAEVSTHSRPKAAGLGLSFVSYVGLNVSTHSRPKAAGAFSTFFISRYNRFNTQPPEGGWDNTCFQTANFSTVSTHSRPKAAGSGINVLSKAKLFQHTAARRRLGQNWQASLGAWSVSTHSRPKAAG